MISSCLNIQLWFLSLTTWPWLDPHKPPVLDFQKPLCHSSDLASYLTSMLPLSGLCSSSRILPNSWNTSDTSRNPWSPQNTLEIFRYEYKVVRHSAQAEANFWTPLSSRLSSAVHWTTMVTRCHKWPSGEGSQRGLLWKRTNLHGHIFNRETNTKEDLARVMTKSRSKTQTVTNGYVSQKGKRIEFLASISMLETS